MLPARRSTSTVVSSCTVDSVRPYNLHKEFPRHLSLNVSIHGTARVLACMLAMNKRPDTMLRLLHLADSALPIGSAAHSYGLEALVSETGLAVEDLAAYFDAYLQEVGAVEAIFCRRAYLFGALLQSENPQNPQVDWRAWQVLNRRLSARKTAREGREASATLGRRLLRLALSLDLDERLHTTLVESNQSDIHHATAFGLIAGFWQLGEEESVLAYLQQTLTGLVSACQRLMPLGQNRAQSIIWAQQTTLAEIASAMTHPDLGLDMPSFTPLLDTAGMRHPRLPVRLFIS